MGDFLFRLLVAGIISAGFSALTYALPWPATVKANKPYKCQLCWCGWNTLAALLVLAHWPGWWFGWPYAFALYFGSLGVCLYVFRQVNPPDIAL